MTRLSDARALRFAAANAQAEETYGTQETNGDEGRYSDYRASYSKGLRHDEAGEVDISAYGLFLNALETGENANFEAIPLGGARRLVSPQAAYRFELVGLDSHKTFMRPAPEFTGLETAAEMGELYWKALCRDVPFEDYSENTLISAAKADLNKFSETVGPKRNGDITVDTIFRGETDGDLIGPYISQFLLKDVPYGNTKIEQRYESPASGDDFMTDFASWLSIQNGTVPSPSILGSLFIIIPLRKRPLQLWAGLMCLIWSQKLAICHLAVLGIRNGWCTAGPDLKCMAGVCTDRSEAKKITVCQRKSSIRTR